MDEYSVVEVWDKMIKGLTNGLKPVIKAINRCVYDISVILSGEEQYKINEKLHPRKKKRGSMRRKRNNRKRRF